MKQTRPSSSTLRFLAPDVLARIHSLELLARTVVEGFMAGLHRSPRLGFSTEFAEYRPYMPGDDLRLLDWKLFARTDRYYVKKFRGDTNTHGTILMDVSASMDYGSGAITKRDYACYLAASLAYLTNRQQDAVGWIAFADELLQYIPAKHRPGHLHTVLLAIEKAATRKQTNIARSLERVAALIKRRGILIVISDLYAEPDEILRGLKHLRFCGHDVLVFHILDEHELDFPFTQPLYLEDLETDEERHVVPERLRAQYLRLLHEHIETLQQECGRAGIDYVLMKTSEPLDRALFSYLSRRAKLY
ncbi:MAG: DUF58 domain-containing protein [Acidobacteriota bacterium]|nr:DUF58 domain-containing protein [Blastocatellia bacterium]MDW8241128.1 DUF58 domain-containing protein [Acidobacteriota bacterium]